MLGTLNEIQIEAVLREQVIGRIGCTDGETVYIVPISYAYDGSHIYGRSKSGMKIDMMRSHSKVCFEVETFENMANWKTVILWGTYIEITDEEERKHALQKLLKRQLPIISTEMAHLSPQWPFEPADINSIDGIVYKIEVQKRSGRFENHEGISEISKSYL